MDNLNRGVKNQNCYLSKLTSLFILSLLVFFLSYNKALAGNVTVVQPTNYVVGINLGVGSQYYIDRTFTITSIPSQLQGPQGGNNVEWIETGNNDKSNTSTNFLSFSIDKTSTVYVAYDLTQATKPPTWLSSAFTKTSNTIGTTDVTFTVYQKTFSAGTVTLGGNRASGYSGNPSMYFVIVIPSAPTPTPTPTPTPISGWTAFDDTGIASNWQVNGTQFTQQNFVGTNLQTYHFGTYLYASSGFSLTDYTVSLNAISLDNTVGNEDADIGVMFRYQDNNNYYRFSMNYALGFTRLEKKVNGVWSTFSVNSRGFIPGQKQAITVVVSSNNILVYLNGEPLFSVQDSSLSSGTIALYCQDKASFDSVSVNANSTAPSIIISSPISYSVQDSSTLDVSAVATNVPAGGGVKFVLDGQTSFIDSSPPYSGQFTGLSKGDHTVGAFIIDSGGNTLASDTNVVVGVRGNYYIGYGDSITAGVEDLYSLDNSSQDGRVIALEGYESNLTDFLNTNNYPNIVFDEGLPGAKSIDGLNDVDSIIERHPNSNKVLILLGTNDSFGTMPVPSGLNCSGSSCNGTFYQNMQTLVNTLNSSGKTPIVALVPPAFGDCSNAISCPSYTNPDSASRNQLIKQYNQVIQNQLTGIQVGPNFYSNYINHFDLFAIKITSQGQLTADNLHPNGLGTVVQAYLWGDSLLNQNGLPFILGNLTPNNGSSPPNYKQNLIQVGSLYYVDRTFTITSIPSQLQGNEKVWIMTGNNDKSNTSTNFLSFSINKTSTVYVAYDLTQATKPPTWLSSAFTKTSNTIGTTDVTFTVYQKTFSAGTVTLGGNRASGYSGNPSMYFVIVQ